MKKILLFAAAASISAASAAGLSFQDLKKLETVDGYTAYGMQSELTQEAYILVDGGEKDGQIASINLNSVLGGEAGFAIVKGKTLAEYADNSDRAEFYQTQCAEQTVRKMDLKKKVIGEPVPFSKLNGVTKAAAGVSCLVEAGQKEAMENAKK